MVQEINANNFKTEVEDYNDIVVVDFYANWCGPCKMLSPVLEMKDKVKFVKINTDENIDTAKNYQISGLPTLLLFKNGNPVDRMVGLMPKGSIITNIEKHV